MSTTANNRLFVGGVPRTLTNAQLKDKLQGEVVGEWRVCVCACVCVCVCVREREA